MVFIEQLGYTAKDSFNKGVRGGEDQLKPKVVKKLAI
jgi:hypothetical protein